MFVGVRASLPLMEACWSEIDRQRGDRREEPLHPPQLPKLLSPGSEKKQRRDFFPLSLSQKKKASCFMHEKIADSPSQDKVQGLSRLQTLSKQSHVLKGWGNGGAGGVMLTQSRDEGGGVKQEAVVPLICTTYSHSTIVKTLKFNLTAAIARV